jgi:phosphatidylinositol glycan class M
LQAVWLSIAYKLEFLAENVFFPLWSAGLLFVMVNTWCIGSIIHAYR